MVKILEPFEIRNCYTANIGEHIWNDLDSSSLKNLITSESCGSICTFDNNFSLNVRCRMRVDDAIYGTWSKNVTFLSHHVERVGSLNLLSVWESGNVALLMLMHL